MGKCSICSTQSECGFCLSTLQCVSGVEEGPSLGLSCPNWIFSNGSCPGNLMSTNSYLQFGILFYFNVLYNNTVVPNCGDYIDCLSCASQEQCAWCASENVCLTTSEGFSKECGGLVFEPPCPLNYIPGMHQLYHYFNFIQNL